MAMIVLINCFRGFANSPIREALAPYLLEGHGRTALVISLAVRVAEGKFFAVALEMRFANVVVRPHKAALHHSEERLDRIAMGAASDERALTCVFLAGVVRHLMRQ